MLLLMPTHGSMRRLWLQSFSTPLSFNGGGNVTRPRAADDFPAIQARMEELRRERTRVPVDDNRMDSPRPYAIGIRPVLDGKLKVQSASRRATRDT
jgi:hypothetical protein